MRRLVTTMAVLALVLAVGSDAFAQRDAGAKARGDHNSFWSPRYSQRSFTNNSLFGQTSRVRVTRVRQATPNVPAPPVTATPAPATVPVAASTSSEAVRSDSGGLPARAYSNARNSKPAWMYPKTDPRRYRS